MTFSLDDSLGFVTNRAANRLKAELERGFAERGFNLTAEQWLVLSRLYEGDGLSQRELAERISKDKTNAARILALLERHQLVERRVDPEDSRIRKIYLTPLARSMQADLVRVAQGVLARAQKNLSDNDVRKVIDLLNTVFDNLS